MSSRPARHSNSRQQIANRCVARVHLNRRYVGECAVANNQRILPALIWLLRASIKIMGALALGATVATAEVPKRGGILTYMIPADGGPSLDGHRETTFAVLHATAPFYSVLIRVNPDNPASTTEFTCDLCREIPTPTDNGLTYTFTIRTGVKFHDG